MSNITVTAPRPRAADHPDHQWRLPSPRRVSQRFISLGRVVYGIYTGCHVKRIHYRNGDALNLRVDNLCPWAFDICAWCRGFMNRRFRAGFYREYGYQPSYCSRDCCYESMRHQGRLRVMYNDTVLYRRVSRPLVSRVRARSSLSE